MDIDRLHHPRPIVGDGTESTEQDLLRTINTARTGNNVPPLILDRGLNILANRFALDRLILGQNETALSGAGGWSDGRSFVEGATRLLGPLTTTPLWRTYPIQANGIPDINGFLAARLPELRENSGGWTHAGIAIVGSAIVLVLDTRGYPVTPPSTIQDTLSGFAATADWPTLIGLSGGDTLTGGAGSNQIGGGDGNDVVYGLGGSDTLFGGRDADTVDGGDGSDLIYGDDGADLLIGGSGNDTIYGGEGVDTLQGGDGDDVVHGYLNLNNPPSPRELDVNVISGGSGNDTLYGTSYGDFLDGGDGHDRIISVTGNELSGGSGNDYIYIGSREYPPGPAIVIAGSGDDTIEGRFRLDSCMIDGGAGFDTLLLNGENNAEYSITVDAQGWIIIRNNFNSNIQATGIEKIQIKDGPIIPLNLTVATDMRITFGSATETGARDYMLIRSDRVLVNNDGNDTLAGSGLRGGERAIFSGPRSDYTITKFHSGHTVKDKHGTEDTLLWIDVASFDDAVIDLATGREMMSQMVVNGALTSPVAGDGSFNIAWVLVAGPDGDRIIGTERNDLINALSGHDAVDGAAGNDILDGGRGSNFLTGGTGFDRFFVDGRGADGRSGLTLWSTVTDFDRASGEQLTVWGFVDGVSRVVSTSPSSGANGYTGATWHFDLNGDGFIDASLTLSGRTLDSVSLTTGTVDGNGYLLIG